MIWATVSSWSCFCWLYRASPSLAAKNIINLISVLTIWWCPYVESSFVLLEEGICYDQCIFFAKLLFFALLHSPFQGQICLLLQVFLDFLLLHSSPLWWKGHLFGVLILEGLVGLHRTVQLQLLQHYWSGQTWITVILNGLPWKRTEVILSFWDCLQVLHFKLFCCPWWLLHFFWGIPAHSSRYNGHLS